jgi:lipoate-protein ligase A
MPPAAWWIDPGACRDPRVNLALEEYCLLHLDLRATFFFCYINTPAVIVGRNQNILAEVDRAYARRHDLPVIRRLSGGGAVYHDEGNLNFSYLSPGSPAEVGRWARWAAPVIEALAALGLRARLTPRHSLEVAGRKISGTAQYARGRRLLSHGTLLFASDLGAMEQALRRPADLLETRGRPSVADRVTNLADHLASPMSLEAFRGHLLAHVERSLGGWRPLRLTAGDWQAIRRLAAAKYGAWEWNAGRSPGCRIRRRVTRGRQTESVDLDIEGGIVRRATAGARLGGVAAIQGRRYCPEDLAPALAAEFGSLAPGLALQLYGA